MIEKEKNKNDLICVILKKAIKFSCNLLIFLNINKVFKQFLNKKGGIFNG